MRSTQDRPRRQPRWGSAGAVRKPCRRTAPGPALPLPRRGGLPGAARRFPDRRGWTRHGYACAYQELADGLPRVLAECETAGGTLTGDDRLTAHASHCPRCSLGRDTWTRKRFGPSLSSFLKHCRMPPSQGRERLCTARSSPGAPRLASMPIPSSSRNGYVRSMVMTSVRSRCVGEPEEGRPSQCSAPQRVERRLRDHGGGDGLGGTVSRGPVERASLPGRSPECPLTGPTGIAGISCAAGTPPKCGRDPAWSSGSTRSPAVVECATWSVWRLPP